MTRERWARVRSIFEDALEQPVEARTEWVRRACQGDEPLVREVWALLRSHDTAGDFLERPAHLDFDLDLALDEVAHYGGETLQVPVRIEALLADVERMARPEHAAVVAAKRAALAAGYGGRHATDG